MDETTSIEDPDQQHCVRFPLTKALHRDKTRCRNLESNNVDFSVSDGSHKTHFMKAIGFFMYS